MFVTTIELNADEVKSLVAYAAHGDTELPDAFRDALLGKIEDAYDLRAAVLAADEHEKHPVAYTMSEIRDKYNL